MKILRSAAICALLGSSVLATAANAAATILSSTPSADPAGLDAGNLATAQAQCNAAATALDADGPSNDSDHYSATVVEGAVTLVSGPTEVGGEGARNIDQSTKVGAGTFTPAHRQILGDPYRNGGSVNMFGIQQTVGGHYSNSAYDFTADFNTTYAHAYSCDASKETYHAAVYHPLVHHNQVGHWIVSPDAHGNEEANTNNCNAFNSALPNGPANGNATDQANCRFIVDEQAYDDAAYTDPAYWDDPVFVANVPGGSFNQTQTDQLSGHESMGAGFDTSETLILGQVVVCISPGPKGGSWKQQNGYTGSKCTTAWYNGGAKVGVPNLNDGSHNWVTIPVS